MCLWGLLECHWDVLERYWVDIVYHWVEFVRHIPNGGHVRYMNYVCLNWPFDTAKKKYISILCNFKIKVVYANYGIHLSDPLLATSR